MRFSDLLSLDQSKTFYKPDWFDIVGAEVKCCKEAVCVIDMSSFTKFELTVSLCGDVSQRKHLFLLRLTVFFFIVLIFQSTGDQALQLLQHLCANDLDVPVGHIVHTGMLNERGGYENDCSVVRISKNRFEQLFKKIKIKSTLYICTSKIIIHLCSVQLLHHLSHRPAGPLLVLDQETHAK